MTAMLCVLLNSFKTFGVGLSKKVTFFLEKEAYFRNTTKVSVCPKVLEKLIIKTLKKQKQSQLAYALRQFFVRNLKYLLMANHRIKNYK